MKTKLIGALLASAIAAVAAPASAAVIVVGSGWQDDEIGGIGTPSTGSAWTFTVAGPSIFRVTDAYIPGDTFSLYSGATLLATTTFTTTAEPIDSFAGVTWGDLSYSRLSYAVGPGSYSFTITGDGAAGVPAGFGVRLDASSAVPEPATWAMMIAGFGLVGGALRQRKATAQFA
ncbi:FxDxF family PEP-CTERM protein [Phenylobacterium sp.]|uniref:FxDxF family PEP-CTERM protein n=1 Tax=Phenylobacterium sp. TaxID=1871053 RepID=UPI00286BCCEF|nr:FxDxF family PEP-CTERM protein [Phenylobacterium sp.]